MNQSKMILRDLFDDMVERKLWPVALILVVALIAIPVVLAKPASKSTSPLPGAAATAPAVSGASSPLTAFEPVVSASAGGAESKGLRGGAKNPFLAKGIDFSASDEAGSVEPIPGLGSAQVSTGETAQGAGGGSGGSTGDAQPGTPTTQGETFYYTYTATIRFGEEGDTKSRTLSEFRAVPSTDNPLAVFMGAKRDGKTAVFLLSSSVTTTGDGDCEPTDSECTFLYLKEGEGQLIETVTAEGEIVTYELELVKINVKRTDGPAKAGASRKSARTSARRALRAFSRLPF